MRRPPAALLGLLALVLLSGAGTVAGPQAALAASAPPTTAPPTMPSATAPPTGAPTPPVAPDVPEPTTASGATVDLDPTLAEMTEAGNHTMGSTVPSNDPSVPAAVKEQAAKPQAEATTKAFPPGVPGLDVSGWQENVNWPSVWAQGARFAYVKATEGVTYRSSQFTQQYNGSYDVGMVRGAYHFARPNVSSATAQADYFVANGGGWRGDSRTLPPLLDIEYNPYVASDGTNTCYGLSAGAMVNWISEFSERIRVLTGARPAIYTTTDWWRTCTGNSAAFGTNPLFIARYPANLSQGAGTLPAGWGAYTFWQYSSTGPFPGDSNTFNGSLATLQQLALTGRPTQHPVIGARDLTGDGRPDLLARRPDGSLWLYPTAGAAGSGVAFGTARQIGTGWGVFDLIVGAGDVTGDGRADVLARKPDGTLYLYEGTGGGNLGTGRLVGTGWDVFTDVIAPGDVDGDGREDLLGRRPDGGLVLYSAQGAGAWRPGVQVGTSWNIFRTVVPAGDVDGDGRPDLVAQRTDGTTWLYRGSGNSYAPGTRLDTGMAASDLLIGGVGDVTGDGRPDLFSRSSDGRLHLHAGTGAAVPAYGAGQLVGTGWNVFRTVVPVGDLDGDGVPDVLGIRRDGALVLYRGRGTAGGVHQSYQDGVLIGSGWEGFSQVTDGGDLTGDGRRDLLAVRNDGAVFVYPGTGRTPTGWYGTPTRLRTPAWSTTEALLARDLDGDGSPDVLAKAPKGTTTVRSGTPRASAVTDRFGDARRVPGLDGAQTLVSAGDLDSNGRTDLVWVRPDGTLAWTKGGSSIATGSSWLEGPATTVGSGWQVFDTVAGTGDARPGRTGDLLGRRPDGTLWYYPATGRAGATDPAYRSRVQVGVGWDVFG